MASQTKTKKPAVRHVQVRLTPEFYGKVVEFARRRGESVQRVVTDALKAYMKR